MARAITSPELTLLRSEGQWSQLFMAVLVPNTIYTARLASLPSSNDQVYEISYNTGSGTLADVKPGMLLYVGTSAGAFDLGMCRIRTAPDGTKIYIGETSEIEWASNCYLTIVDDFDIHPRHVHVDDSGVLLMDVDIAYDDQHLDFDPVPVLGSHAVLWLTGATVAVDFDASDSWVFDSTISAYAWEAPGAASIIDDDTATPTITYDAAGIYRVLCTVTALNGKTAMGARYVFVYNDANPPATVFQLANCEGSVDTGGWMFDVTMQAEASLAEIRERTMVVLFAKDYYQGTEQSIGPIAGRENVIAVGRVGPSESIRWDPVAGQAHFTVYGPHYWMNKIKVSACQLEFTNVSPVDWGHIKNLTVDRALWHLLHWRSTATMVMDFYPTGDSRLDNKAASLANFLWAQLTEIAGLKIMGHVLCDRYGRLFAEIDPQMVPAASRSSFPTIMTVTEDDWMDVIDFERVTAHETGQVNISTRIVNSSGASTTVYSLSPGHIPRKHGDWEINDGMLAASQTASNQLAGLLLGWKNNPFPDIPLKFAQNNRMIDICPHQVLDFTVLAADTPRGVGYDGNIIPRRVAFSYDADARWLSTQVNNEGETFEQVSCNGDIPGSSDVDLSIPPLPSFPSLPDLPLIIPGTTEPTPEGPRKIVVHDPTIGFLLCENFNEDNPVYMPINAGLTQDQYQDAEFLFICPNGAMYCGLTGTTTEDEGAMFVARTPSAGGTWEILYDVSNLDNGEGRWGVSGAGCNPLLPESVGLVLLFSADSNPTFYLGANTVFNQGCAVTASGYFFPLITSYGLGKWMVTSYGNQANGRCRIISADGETLESVLPLATLNPAHIRASSTGRTYHQRIGNGLIIAEDNFATIAENTDTDIHVAADPPGPHAPVMACDPTGQYLMERYGASLSGRSSDFGSTWVAMGTGIPVANHCFAYAGGSGLASRWIAVSAYIKYSADFGSVWVGKEGNINLLTPFPALDMVRVLEY